MEVDHEKHWEAAQAISFSVDLIAAAKAHLRFLASVDCHPSLLQHGPALQHAISRYENCWLPLLAKHSDSGRSLVPPLECAWVWHCHKLNPVQYVKDCDSLYGRLLDGAFLSDDDDEAIKSTEMLWDSLYPHEKYRIDSNELQNFKNDGHGCKIKYDLEAAVLRQCSFYYQVSMPHMGEDSFLKVSLQRYKGYLYLLKLSNLRVFLVPTYDIDLMWHSHQNSPQAYGRDMLGLLGRVLNHDDTDPDRSEGKKLDMGFNHTRGFWEHTFGTVYERAGAMYRGEPPTPLPAVPSSNNNIHAATGSIPAANGQCDGHIQARNTMQVFVTVLGARNVHPKHKGSLAVQVLFQNNSAFSDLETHWVKAGSNVEWNSFWSFQCVTSTEGLRLELQWRESINCFSFLAHPKSIGPKSIGYLDISWETILNSPTLSQDGWVPLHMQSKLYHDCKPVSLQISVSVTPPHISPYLLHIYPHASMCEEEGTDLRTVVDHMRRVVFYVRVRWLQHDKFISPSLIEVFQAASSGAKLLGYAKQIIESDDGEISGSRKWSLLDNAAQVVVTRDTRNLNWSCQFDFSLTSQSLSLFRGRKLQYEQIGAQEDEEAEFVTLVRYSQDAPSGKATALINWSSGVVEVCPGENVVFVMLLSMALSSSIIDPAGLKWGHQKRDKARASQKDTRPDEWGSLVLNGHCPSFASYLILKDSCPSFIHNIVQSYAWYSMGSNPWMSSFYQCGLAKGAPPKNCRQGGGTGRSRGVPGNGSMVTKVGGKPSRGGSCGGCGSGGCGGGRQNESRCKKSGVKITTRNGCGGCGSGGCGGGCGSGGCGGGCGNKTTPVRNALGSGCGGCGSGGCGNSITMRETLRANRGGVGVGGKSTFGSGCGGCGAGGCGSGCGNTKSC